MKNAKQLFWKKYKFAFAIILFAIGFMAIGSFTDITTSLVLATALPIVWIKGGKFTAELTDAELEKLNEKDFIVYMKELQSSKFEMATKAFEEKLQDVISKSDFKKLKDGLDKLNKEKEENLEARIKEFEKMAEKISKNVVDANIEAENKTLSGFEISLKNAKTNKDSILKDEIKNHKDGNKFAFTIKATFVGGDVGTLTGNIGSQRISGIGQIASAKLVLSSFFNISPIEIDGNGVAVYEDWDEATTISAAAAIAAGGTFPSSTAKFKSYSITIEKVGDSISMTYESIRDFARFTRELSRFITRNIALVVNQALWNGSGVTPIINGIFTQATAFNAAGYTGQTTITPDILDLIKVLVKQIMNGKDAKYDVNFAFISWEDYLGILLAKDTTGRLLYPNGVPSVMGVELIPTSLVADNTMLTGDKDYVELIGDPNAITIEVGLKSGDWENDRESVKGRVRTALLIRNVDLDGFLKVSSISAAITAITTV